MENIIVKTAVKTALILLGMLIIAFAVFNFVYPQHMATFTEGIGNYSLAVKYSSLRYTYTGDGYDLARCVDDSILWGKDDPIANYGTKLLNHDRFEEVCEWKDEQFEGKFSYLRFVSGKVAVADYNLGDYSTAKAVAFKANGYSDFENGNPVMSLALRIVAKEDKENAQDLMAEMAKITPANDKQQAILTETSKRLKTVTLN